MRKFIATLLASAVLVFGGAACDDGETNTDTIDEDDGRLGPGDDNDEVGPGR